MGQQCRTDPGRADRGAEPADRVDQPALLRLQTGPHPALRHRAAVLPYAVVSNPEFLKEGVAIDDFMRPDRIVVGVDEGIHQAKSQRMMGDLYASFNRHHARTVWMDVRSAELTKYAANAMLATRISFMNELALLADQVGVDIELVRKGIGSDPRIGTHFLYAGAGYGGSCFPKDVQALAALGKANGCVLFSATRRVTS